MAQEMAGDDLAKAILSGPLTLEKLASLSTLKVSGTRPSTTNAHLTARS